jgi:hypothetical protein
VKAWLDKNPNEGIVVWDHPRLPELIETFVVVTLLVTNPDSLEVLQYWAPSFVESGIDKVAYAPSSPVSRGNWPTLGQMIDSGQRVVVFMDFNSNTTEVPYILPEFNDV